MKKILLSAVALVAAMSANAQVVAFNEDNPLFSALGLNSDGVTETAGTEIGSIEGVISFKIGAEDTYKPQNRGPVTVADTEVKGGLQGSSNPKDADGGTPASTLKAPVQGAFFVADVGTDGYLYVFQHASSNKAYTIFENDDAIGYIYSAVGDASTALGAQYGFELKGGGEYNYLKDGGIEKVNWPEQIYLNWDGETEWTNIAKSGSGVIKFPIFAGCKYYINANGSKMTAIGFYYDTTGDATITAVAGEEAVTLLQDGQLPGAETAIKSVKAENASADAYFTVNGQRVDANTKGIVIVGGKKYLNK